VGREKGKAGLSGKARGEEIKRGSKEVKLENSKSVRKPLPLSGTKGDETRTETDVARPEPRVDN
jgi:hypothetical protein